MPDDQQPISGAEGQTGAPEATEAPKVTTRTRTRKTAAPVTPPPAEAAAEPTEATEPAPASDDAPATAKKAAAKRTATKKTAAKKTTTKKAAAKKGGDADQPLPAVDEPATTEPAATAEPAAPAPTVTTTTRSRRTTKKAAAETPAAPEVEAPTLSDTAASVGGATMPLFQTPEKAPESTTRTTVTRRPRKTAAQKRAETEAAEAETAATLDAVASVEASGSDEPAAAAAEEPTRARKTTRKRSGAKTPAPEPVEDEDAVEDEDEDAEPTEPAEATDSDEETETDEDSADEQQDDQQGEGGGRRRRRRGGRRRRRSGEGGGSGDDDAEGQDEQAEGSSDESSDDTEDGGDSSDDQGGDGTSRRRRRRRRGGDSAEGSDDPENTVTRVRRPRNAEDEITSLAGSTRLEAKKQRRREGREAGRRRAPIVSEAEFLARRESVDRTMAVRQRGDLTQIAVLEDKVLVEHYVARESQTSLIGNVYLGRVQNVLPSMEAAFIDIGKGRNAVLYAGEVNWSSLGHKEGQPRKIEAVLSSGQPILVQVTKDPIGHKGARLTSQVSLAGRFLVYVPDGTTSGISRKLPDTERNRLKTLLKEIVPESAGVIVRTAAEGASEEELTTDVERLKARWEDIEAKVGGSAPQLLYGEPDLTLKVVRDLFTEDFSTLVIQGDDAWDTVQGYVSHVAPDLEPRLQRYDPAEHSGHDLFATYRVDEQIAKGLDRKVWLPSGGSLVIDRTEAMTVVDVNTGKFTGSGGNLEETVTKNNLEAAEEIVRQLRLRDIGGIIVVDFIDMVLESNRDLVLRRLVECLGRDRTRHQVAEVTSLGLVQMTRKRIGTGLLEAFSENCSHCQGRGLVLHDAPVESGGGGNGGGGGGSKGGGGGNGGGNGGGGDDEPRRGRRRGGRGGRGEDQQDGADTPATPAPTPASPSPAFVAAIARPENADAAPLDGLPALDDAADGEVLAERPAESSEEQAAAVNDVAAAVDPASDAATDVAVAVEATESAGEAALPVEDQIQAEPPTRDAGQPTGEPDDSRDDRQDDQQHEQGAGFPEPAQQPQVVTRTRRRSASRPAGPPEGAMTPEFVVVSPDAEPVDIPTGDLPVVEHVPIKRKGTRKR